MDEPQATVKVVDKAFAYITSHGRLLVFEHVAFPDAGIQVPAGTILDGEAPALAVVREATEETGLDRFASVELIGICELDARPYGKDEIHRRHFFHLPLSGTAPERWRHHERHASDGDGSPIELELYWLSFDEADKCLAYDHGSLLQRLR